MKQLRFLNGPEATPGAHSRISRYVITHFNTPRGGLVHSCTSLKERKGDTGLTTSLRVHIQCLRWFLRELKGGPRVDLGLGTHTHTQPRTHAMTGSTKTTHTHKHAQKASTHWPSVVRSGFAKLVVSCGALPEMRDSHFDTHTCVCGCLRVCVCVYSSVRFACALRACVCLQMCGCACLRVLACSCLFVFGCVCALARSAFWRLLISCVIACTCVEFACAGRAVVRPCVVCAGMHMYTDTYIYIYICMRRCVCVSVRVVVVLFLRLSASSSMCASVRLCLCAGEFVCVGLGVCVCVLIMRPFVWRVACLRACVCAWACLSAACLRAACVLLHACVFTACVCKFVCECCNPILPCPLGNN